MSFFTDNTRIHLIGMKRSHGNQKCAHFIEDLSKTPYPQDLPLSCYSQCIGKKHLETNFTYKINVKYIHTILDLCVRRTRKSSRTYNTAINAKCAAPAFAGLTSSGKPWRLPKRLTYRVRRLISAAKIINRIRFGNRLERRSYGRLEPKVFGNRERFTTHLSEAHDPMIYRRNTKYIN